jgi:[acyl-carrier-protein] S-malonyltransferase
LAGQGFQCTLAALNSPEQTVISGSRESVELAVAVGRKLALFKRSVPLEVSVAFHSPIVAPAVPKLAEVLARTPFGKLSIPVISNVTGKPVRQYGGASGTLGRWF